MVRFPTPSKKYNQDEEAGFRRMVSESMGNNEFPEIRIGGGVIYPENGNLKFKSANGTITIIAPL